MNSMTLRHRQQETEYLSNINHATNDIHADQPVTQQDAGINPFYIHYHEYISHFVTYCCASWFTNDTLLTLLIFLYLSDSDLYVTHSGNCVSAAKSKSLPKPISSILLLLFTEYWVPDI